MNAPASDDLFAWLDLRDEQGLRDLVLSLAARHGLLATERRWWPAARSYLIRVRSLARGGEGHAVEAAYLRHPEHDRWAHVEWPAMPDDVLEPDAPDVGDPSALATCWLHAPKMIPDCGCPTMGRASAPSDYEAFTGESAASSPFAREVDVEAATASLSVVWRQACPDCRRNVVQPTDPGRLCPECGHPALAWRCGIDREPLVQWAPAPPSRFHSVTAQAEEDGAQNTSAPESSSSHPSGAVPEGLSAGETDARPARQEEPTPVGTVPAGANTRAEGPSPALLPPSLGVGESAPPLAPTPAPAVDSYMAAYYEEQMRARRGPVVAPVEAPLVQPTPAVVAAVAQAAGNVEAKRRNHRWDHGRCLRCGVAQSRSAPPCSGERAA